MATLREFAIAGVVEAAAAVPIPYPANAAPNTPGAMTAPTSAGLALVFITGSPPA